VDRLRLNVNQLQSVSFGEIPNRAYRKIEGVLVIDLIVGSLLDNVSQIRIFEGENSPRLEQLLYPGKDRMNIRNVAHHVGAEESIGWTVLGKNLLGHFRVKETASRSNPF
jgi:hypothetical protein